MENHKYPDYVFDVPVDDSKYFDVPVDDSKYTYEPYSIDCTYFISLPKLYPDRNAYLQQYCSYTNWNNVLFWPAITPSELPSESDKLYRWDSSADDICFRVKHAATTMKCSNDLLYIGNEVSGYNRCLFHSNREIFQHAVEKGYNCIAIFEDDILFHKQFPEKLDKYMLQFMNSDADILTIGDGCKIHISNYLPDNASKLSDDLWLNKLSHVRCTDSLIYKQNAIQKMAKYLSSGAKRHLPIDWEYNWLFRELGLKVAWAEPTIITQSSQLHM